VKKCSCREPYYFLPPEAVTLNLGGSNEYGLVCIVSTGGKVFTVVVRVVVEVMSPY
jgi:hypothetical protein